MIENLTEAAKKLADPATSDEEAKAAGIEIAIGILGLFERGVVALENIARSKGFEPE